jgi:hypothetical protein
MARQKTVHESLDLTGAKLDAYIQSQILKSAGVHVRSPTEYSFTREKKQ